MIALLFYGVDGTSVRALDSGENRAHFGGSSSGREKAATRKCGWSRWWRCARTCSPRRGLPFNAAGETTLAAEFWSQPALRFTLHRRSRVPGRELPARDRGTRQQPPLDEACEDQTRWRRVNAWERVTSWSSWSSPRAPVTAFRVQPGLALRPGPLGDGRDRRGGGCSAHAGEFPRSAPARAELPVDL